MSIIEITPVMTSNDTPTPYVVSASSSYGGNYQPYCVFNPTPTNYYWLSARGYHLNSWVALDFGEEISMTSVSIKNSLSASSTDYPCMPKELEIHTSNDGVVFDVIKSIAYNDKNWSIGEERMINLGKVVTARYIKFVIRKPYATNTNGNNYSTLGTVRIFFDPRLSTDTPISHKNVSLTYILPMSTSLKIKTIHNDSRVGRLGMANDPDNFGDLYVIGYDGKAHLTKSRIKSETLFEGAANNTGVYNLGKSVSTHKFLSIYGDIADGSYAYSMLIDVEELKNRDYIFEIYEQNHLIIRLISDSELEIKSKNNLGHSDGRITKVIGLY